MCVLESETGLKYSMTWLVLSLKKTMFSTFMKLQTVAKISGLHANVLLH